MTYSDPNQTSKLESIGILVNGLNPLTIFAIFFILDV